MCCHNPYVPDCNFIFFKQIQEADSSKDQLFGPEDEIPQHLEEIIDRYIIMSFDNQEENMEENLEENLGEDLENIGKLLNLWETL